MSSQLDTILEYYANLLIIQYRNKPKARQQIKDIVSVLFPVNEATGNLLILDVRDCYNLDTAIGVQLDIVGKYAGIDRFYSGQALDGISAFALVGYNQTPTPSQLGFATYSTNPTTQHTLSYKDLLSLNNQLDDDDYRVLIKLKIVQNNINNSRKQIDDDLFKFFGNSIYASSRGNMKMTYFIPSTLTALIKVAIQKGVLPRPLGVRLDYLIPVRKNYFGFATYNGYPSNITGFSTYSETKDGNTLHYKDLIEV